MDITQLCIDTSPLIAYLKGRDPGATAVERAVKECECYVTAITVYEMMFGVARARKHIGEVAARQAAKLHDQLIRSNNDVGVKDILIASIWLERAWPLLTLNEKHFSRVPGLTVFTPDSIAVSPGEPFLL